MTDGAGTATVSAAELLEDSGDAGVFTLLQTGMMGWQKAQPKKTKTQKNKKHALRPFQQQQHAATAQTLDGGEINEEYGLYTSELERANPEDDRYKKDIYVKTWTERTITAVIDPESEVKNLKRLAAAKTGIPTESQQLTFGGKVLTDKALMKEYNISGGATIEMTAKLLGGMKKKSLSPRPMDTERDKKRKESEPCIEVGDSLEDENAQTHLDIDPSDNARWIEDTMKRLKDRTDDVSELETNMSGVKWQMTEVEKRLETVSDSLIKLTEGKAEQDKKLDALLCCFKEGMEVREKKIEDKMENMEKSLSERMNGKFSEFDKRITSIECSVVGGAGHVGPGSPPGGWGPTPTCLKAVIHGFKEAKEKELRSLITKVISDTGMKEEHFVDYPAVPITHAFIEFKETRIRDRFVRSAYMRRYVLDGGGVIRISQALTAEERIDKKRLGSVKYTVNKNTKISLHNIHMDLEKKNVTVYGQLTAKIERNGYLQYYTHGDVEDEVRNLMDKWLTKNL